MNSASTPSASGAQPGRDTPRSDRDTPQPDRTAQYNALYNELDAHLRRELRIEHRYDFMDLVTEGARRGLVNPSLVNELRDCKALRNLLVHTSRYPHEALAAPTVWGLERFRDIVEGIVHPDRVYPAFRRQVRVFAPRDPFDHALRHMAENEYSQVVVRANGHLTLLSSEGIARWLTAHARDDTLAVSQTSVGDVLSHEPDGSFALLARSATIDEARDLFEHAPGLPAPRVQAVVITENGRETEEPLGFATPWDLMADE